MSKVFNRDVDIVGGARLLKDGAEIIDKDGAWVGGITAPAGSIGTTELADDAVTFDKLAESVEQVATVTISAADIVATAAGKFGHASGYPLVADPGTGKVVQLISAVLSYTHSVAAFTGGGNTTININGGAAVTGVIANSAFAAAAASSVTELVPLAAAGNVKTANKGLNLVTASAFTQPGTAAGTIKAIVHYRIVTL